MGYLVALTMIVSTIGFTSINFTKEVSKEAQYNMAMANNQTLIGYTPAKIRQEIIAIKENSNTTFKEKNGNTTFVFPRSFDFGLR